MQRSKRQETRAQRRARDEAEGIPSARQLISELLVIFGVIALGVTVFLWWHFVASNPKRVFDGMLNNLMQTPSGTIEVSQKQDDQSFDQVTEFRTDSTHLAHSVTTQKQNASTVVTEGIGTPNANYIRLTKIETTQRSQSGQPLNFNPVLNIWANNASTDNLTSGQYYQTVVGPFPFANLPLDQRQEVIRLMKQTYTVDYSNVVRQKSKGRPTYIYTVTIEPVARLKMLKLLGKYTGNDQLSNLDLAQYAGSAAFDLQVRVDVWSRQILALKQKDSNAVETITQLGRTKSNLPDLPSESIPANELQGRLQAIQ